MCVFALCEGVITKAIHKSNEEEKKEEEVKKTLEQHDSIVTQYKELIREQVSAAPFTAWFSSFHCTAAICDLLW